PRSTPSAGSGAGSPASASSWSTSCSQRDDGRNSPLGAGFQLGDQRFDLAAVTANVGIVFRAPGHEHADALGLDVHDTQALAIAAHLPLNRDRLAAALVEFSVAERYAASPRGDTAHGHRLAGILPETL